MSAFLSLRKSDEILLMADGAMYEPTGILTKIGSKIHRVPNMRAAIVARGPSSFCAAFLDYVAERGRFRDFDDLIIRCPVLLSEFCASALTTAKLSERKNAYELVIAGFSESRKKSETYTAVGPKLIELDWCIGKKPHALYPTKTLYTGGPGLSELPSLFLDWFTAALKRKADPHRFDSFRPQAEGLAFFEAMRNSSVHGVFEDKQEASFYCVGGFVELTRITAKGISSEILRYWPDKVGARIDPRHQIELNGLSSTTAQGAIDEIKDLVDDLENSAASDVENDSSVAGDTIKDALDALNTDKVDTADLDSAAFESASSFATAAQGALANSAVQPSSIRELLAANRTYYVDASAGSDTNDGLTDETAFATVNKALSTIRSKLDVAGFTITIQLGDGTYTGNVGNDFSWVGGGEIIITGKNTTGTIITAATGNTFGTSGILGGRVTIQNMKLTNTGSGALLNHSAVGMLKVGANIEWGAATGGYHIRALVPGAYILATNGYTISGGAFVHALLAHTGYLQIEGGTITLTGTPAFTGYYLWMNDVGHARITATFSGSATGIRYNISENSVASGGGVGESYLPGDTDGSKATGGQYSL